MLLFCAFLLAVLFSFNIRYWKPDLINYLSGIYICAFTGCFLEIGAFWIDGLPEYAYLNELFNMLYLGSIGIMSVCYFFYAFSQFPYTKLKEKRLHAAVLIPFIAEMLILLSAPFTKLIFYIDDAGYYHRASTFAIQFIPYGYVLAGAITSMQWHFKAHTTRERNLYRAIALFALPAFTLGAIQILCPANIVDTLEFSVTLALVVNYAVLQNNRITRDALTGLANREELDRILGDSIRSHKASDLQKLYVLMGDVDGFKAINDTYGHTEGDRALVITANVLQETASRYYGIAARYGGDEFTIIINSENDFVPEIIIKDIADRLAEASIAEPFKLAMSFGVTDHRESDTLTAILKRADSELYRNKREGRKNDVRNAEFERIASRINETAKRTLLVIDDNEMDREMLQDILGLDYHVLMAEEGREGLKMLQQHFRDISLVLLDLQMPVMDGIDFLKSANRDRLLNLVPIMVATSDDSDETEAKCLKLGAADFVPKPYKPGIMLSRIANIIKLKESAAALSAIEYDELTGLYTRQAFYHHAELMLKQNPDKKYTLIISDIDEFKMVNEKYGEDMGNAVIKAGADSLKPCIDMGMLVGRYGGDRFACMMEFDRESGALGGEAGRHVNKFGDPGHQDPMLSLITGVENSFPVKGLQVKMGIYDDVDHDLPVSILCDRALMAVKSIKHQYGMSYAFYNGELQEQKEKEQHILESMREAYEQEQFRVYYQPKHDVETGRLIGAEALVRWIHPEYGFMSPAEFIPLFEKNGFITYVDYYVWKHSCINIKRWLDKGLRVVPISVNSSRRDFEYEDYLKIIMMPVEANGIDPELLHIEVTESVFSSNISVLVDELKACREKGFRIEMDDFGSGYSSLNILSSLPLDIVKLDRSFMSEIHDERKNRVLASCVGLSKTLGLTTIAEGVENVEQLNVLKTLGCEGVQGYYYAKPMPADEFEEYLRTH